jgi:eukaryotic-like serine/threonine-protein kinase
LTPQRWRRISKLLEKVLAEPCEARAAWLDRHCQGANADLRLDLERLIRADEAAGDFLTEPPLPHLADHLERDAPDKADPSGRKVGAWRLMREIGRGGMGSVYLAERIDGQFDQQVALKLLNNPSPAREDRFARERSILAGLKHPNIAQLYDGGVTEDGLQYLVMEYVDGVSLTDYCGSQKPSLTQRLQLFILICQAVHYAHQNLVVHRDIKPANVMVDFNGRPRLLDFGVAKLLGESDLTLTQARTLTPDYAAPEQILGEPVTTAVDIYALGLLLYEMLSGSRPYTLPASSPASWAHIITNLNCLPPSQAAMRSAHSEIRAGSRNLRGDVDMIVLTALRRDPARRYASAQELGEDVKRFLQKQPIQARADSMSYLASRFIRRHWLASVATTAVILALSGTTAIALWQAEKASQQAEIALQSKDFVVSLLRQTNPVRTEQGIEYRAVDLMRDTASIIAADGNIPPALQAELKLAIAMSLLDLGESADALPLAEQGLAQLRTTYGSDALELVGGLYTLARIQANRGSAEKTEALAREAIALIDRHGGTVSLDSVRLIDMLARSMNTRGRHEEAIALYERSLAERIKLFGPDQPALASVFNNLGSSLVLAERYAAAEEVYNQSRRLLTKEFGADHPNMSHIHIGLGAAQMGQQRWSEAEDHFFIARDIARRKLGPRSARLVSIKTNIGQLRRNQGRLPEAQDWLEKAIALSSELNSDMDAAVAGVWLGLVLLDQDKFGAAQSVLDRAEAGLAMLGLKGTPRYHLVCTAQGVTQAMLGDASGGRAMAEAAISAMEANGQSGHQLYREAIAVHARLSQPGAPEQE